MVLIMKKILQQALKDIKPDRKQQKEVAAKINSIISRINLKDAEAILGGSGIKGTWLKDSYDADIFVCFDYNKYKNKHDELPDILEKHLKRKFGSITRLHGSRDYFQIDKKGFSFEIIPILKIDKADKAQNITDVSPLHARFIEKYSHLADEMRLLKQFCKANNIYGAESYINGFSGYVCELLIVHYKSFRAAIRNAAKWKKKVVIDTKGYYRNRNIFMELNKSKQQGPLIIIDPVQSSRNAAAAVSQEKFDLFRKKAIEFLKNPSIRFFRKKDFSVLEIRKKFRNAIILKMMPLKGKKDVVGCKLVKVLNLLYRALIKNDFHVDKHGWSWNHEAVMYFVTKESRLPSTSVKEGPPIQRKEHVKRFRRKYKATYMEDGRIKAKVKRKYLKPAKLIKDRIRKKDILSKVAKIAVI